MSRELSVRAAVLFQEVLELPPEERAGLLEARCRQDEVLRREVEALLARDCSDGSGFLDTPVLHELLRVRLTPLEGQALGSYRLLELLGEGGMGQVFLATRDDAEFDKRVAIKLLKNVRDSATTRRRLRQERQILAGLEHPNIARLLDGGTTPLGAPYVVMELVEGQPITRYCDARRLTVRRRLELFLEVCDAVRYAHQTLVVHRDLKPSNILVTDDGVPKLLDFGIAKVLEPASENGGEETLTSERVCTINYASPEQAVGARITTASDTFSLGVILFELLTGELPFERSGSVQREAPEELWAAIPPLASARAARNPHAARARGATPEALGRRLRGDLDTIVAKALRPEPARRYGSVEALAEDVRRHLAGEAVLARRASIGYRAGKWMQRHSLAAGAAIVIVAVSLAFAVSLAIQLRRAERERTRAEEVTRFLVDTFAQHDPLVGGGSGPTVEQYLDQAVRRAAAELEHQPDVQAALRHTIATVYHGLGRYETARDLMLQALKQRRRLHGEASLPVAESLVALAETERALGDFVAAEASARSALSIRLRLTDPTDPAVAECRRTLAIVQLERGESEAAEAEARRALDIDRAAGSERGMLSSLAVLGDVLYEAGHYEELLSLAQEAVQRSRQAYQSPHLAIGDALYDLGTAQLALGRHGEAETSFREALAQHEGFLGPEHPTVVATLNALAVVLRWENELEEAAVVAERARAMGTRYYSADSPSMATILNNQGLVYKDLGRFGEAESLFLRVLEIFTSAFGRENPSVATVLNNLANVREDAGKLSQAEEAYRESLAIRRTLLGDRHPMTLRTVVALANVLHHRRQDEEAEALLRTALPEIGEVFGAQHHELARALISLSALAFAAGRFTEAEDLARRALPIYRETYGDGDWRIALVEARLGAALVATARLEEGRELLVQSYRAMLGSAGVAPGYTAEVERLLRDAAERGGQEPDALVEAARRGRDAGEDRTTR